MGLSESAAVSYSKRNPILEKLRLKESNWGGSGLNL